MRIMIIHRSYALVGGAERVIIDKANYLARNGHQLMLVSYEQGKHPLPYELYPSVRYKDLDCRFFTLSRYSLFMHLYNFFRLKKRFRENLKDAYMSFNPDVVVLASDWLTLINSVIGAVKPVPVIAEFHNAYEHVIRKVGVSNGWLRDHFSQMFFIFALKGLKRCAQLVVLTESDACGWRQHFSNVKVIPNPVTSYPDVIDDVTKDHGRIIFVGRFNREKRIDILITAFSMIAEKYPQWHVDIFGEGVEKNRIIDYIFNMKLVNRIRIHEPTMEIYDEYKRSEFLVLCSEHEASPLVLVEAMACGVPCISFDCPNGPREIIKDGETGLLVSNGNVYELSKKIEWLINHDTERIKMGKNARKFAETRKISVVMDEWIKVYSGMKQ